MEPFGYPLERWAFGISVTSLLASIALTVWSIMQKRRTTNIEETREENRRRDRKSAQLTIGRERQHLGGNSGHGLYLIVQNEGPAAALDVRLFADDEPIHKHQIAGGNFTRRWLGGLPSNRCKCLPPSSRIVLQWRRRGNKSRRPNVVSVEWNDGAGGSQAATHSTTDELVPESS